jgi:hypothetical protein
MEAEMLSSESQRNDYRVPVRLHAALELGKDAVRVLVRDLSMRGLSVAVEKARLDLSEDRVGVFRGRNVVVRVPTRDTVLELPGRIAWVNNVAIDHSEIVVAGIELADIPAETRATLRSWLLHALSAVRDAARYAMDSRWERAAAALAEIGFESPTRAVLSGVLRYAANGHA